MTGLDTNVLVRFLVEDDATQSAKATQLIRGAVAKEEVLYVSTITMCEVVWVLTVSYKFKRGELVEVLKQLIRAKQLMFSDVDLLGRAVLYFERGKGDFADYVIREEAKAAGYKQVATFDRVLLKEDGFVSP